ncbi:MAG: hypothetical protein LUQ12_00615, partial [Methanoregulaceae archaeon]|nr:hypothetical protein [Methanoregulaceae archaeon]
MKTQGRDFSLSEKNCIRIENWELKGETPRFGLLFQRLSKIGNRKRIPRFMDCHEVPLIMSSGYDVFLILILTAVLVTGCVEDRNPLSSGTITPTLTLTIPASSPITTTILTTRPTTRVTLSPGPGITIPEETCALSTCPDNANCYCCGEKVCPGYWG